MANAKKSFEDKFKFVEFLQVFLPVVDSRIPTKINDGGCGIFAYHLHDAISKLGFNPTLKYIGEKKSEKDLKEFVTNNRFNDENLGVLHCQVLLSDSLCLDSCGLKTPLTLINNTKKKGQLIVGEITPEALKIMNDHVGSWNIIFDRDCEAQIITELATMGDEFEKFKNGTSKLAFAEKVKYTKKTIASMQKVKLQELGGSGGIGDILSMMGGRRPLSIKGKKMPTFEDFEKGKAEGKTYEEITGESTPEGMPSFEDFSKQMRAGKPLSEIFDFDKILGGKKEYKKETENKE